VTDEELQSALEAVREDNRRALAALEQRMRPATTRELLRVLWHLATWPFRCLAQVWAYSNGVQRACIVSGGLVLAFLAFVLTGCSSPEYAEVRGSNLSRGAPPVLTVCGLPARVVGYGSTGVEFEMPDLGTHSDCDVCVSTSSGTTCSGRAIH
jgi:hypothetical protein